MRRDRTEVGRLVINGKLGSSDSRLKNMAGHCIGGNGFSKCRDQGNRKQHEQAVLLEPFAAAVGKQGFDRRTVPPHRIEGRHPALILNVEQQRLAFGLPAQRCRELLRPGSRGFLVDRLFHCLGKRRQ